MKNRKRHQIWKQKKKHAISFNVDLKRTKGQICKCKSGSQDRIHTLRFAYFSLDLLCARSSVSKLPCKRCYANYCSYRRYVCYWFAQNRTSLFVRDGMLSVFLPFLSFAQSLCAYVHIHTHTPPFSQALICANIRGSEQLIWREASRRNCLFSGAKGEVRTALQVTETDLSVRCFQSYLIIRWGYIKVAGAEFWVRKDGGGRRGGGGGGRGNRYDMTAL